jgi:hypothetical protein
MSFLVIFSQFLPIFANFCHILNSKNNVLKKIGRGSLGPKQICLFRFSESTCSGVSKTENHFDVHRLLGQLVPQHDVLYLMYTKEVPHESNFTLVRRI